MFIGRKKELEWLNCELRISPLVLISGVRGVGKTHFIRQWLSKNPKRFHWYTMERFKDLAKILGQTKGSSESALLSASQTWQNVDIIIWDDFHLLSPTNRKLLFSFLKNSPYLPPQIFLSDEKVLEINHAQLDITEHSLVPFDNKEVEEYLTVFAANNKPSEKTTEIAFKMSGGIPLLLRLWIQNQDTYGAFQTRVLENLLPEEKKLLMLAAMIGRPFHIDEIAKNFNEKQLETILRPLQRKCLLDNTPGSEGQIQVPSYVRSLCLLYMSQAEKQERSNETYELLVNSKNSNPLELCIHALRSQNIKYIIASLNKNIIEQLEHLRREDLIELHELIASIDKKSLTKQTQLMIAHIQLKILFLVGKRTEAIEAATTTIEQINYDTPLSKEEELFALEYVQGLNRISQHEKARTLADKLKHKSSFLIGILLHIEQAVSWMQQDLNHAQTILHYTLQKLKDSHGEDVYAASFAQAYFQLGRSYDIQNKVDDAEVNYSLALKFFKKADKPYFAAVTLLNRAWLTLKSSNWIRLQEISSELQPTAERHGYHYVLAGILIIEATKERLFFNYNIALQKIESALGYLGTNSPKAAYFDAQAEYIRILQSLGLHSRAKKLFQELRKFSEGNSRLQILSESLELEIVSSKINVEDWLELYDKLKLLVDDEMYLLFCLRHGISMDKQPSLEKIKLYPALESAYYENALTYALHKNNAEEVWRLITKLERILSTATEPLPEKIALLLLQASLVKDSLQKEQLIFKVSLELQRWPADLDVRAPLEAWFESLKDKTNIAEHSKWQKANSLDRHRWRRWWQPLIPRHSQPWLLITTLGRTDVEHLPARTSCDLYVIEHLAEVYWQQKPMNELMRRHSLRKILSLLLESFPESVEKQTIASVVWGERYSPNIHDPRIYTSIQRLRSLFFENDCIQSWNNGYRWNPRWQFLLARSQQKTASTDSRHQNIILHTLDRFFKNGRPWISRSELVDITKASEATVKRELAKLLGSSLIQRKGKGRSVAYSLYQNLGNT